LGHELGVRVPLSIWVYEGVHVHAYEEKEEDYIKRRKKACFLNLWSLPVLANLSTTTTTTTKALGSGAMAATAATEAVVVAWGGRTRVRR